VIGTEVRELEDQVAVHLSWLSFAGLERAVELLLASKGYKEVRIVGCQNWRGRSNYGGIDIVARMEAQMTHSLVLVQVKQSGPVQRRFVDELRGAMLRHGASQGIIVSTGEFSRAALDSAQMFPGRPVRLISGKDLAPMFIRAGLGVRPKPLEPKCCPKLVLDELFFETIDEAIR